MPMQASAQAPANDGQIVFSFFKRNSAYFPPCTESNDQPSVDGLDGLLDRLQAEGVTAFGGGTFTR